MIKLLVVFGCLFGLFYIGIPAFRTLTGREKWELTKIVAYSIMCSVIAVICMTLIVVLF